MAPTPESVHSALRLAKGLAIASFNANMDSRKNSEKSDKLQDEQLEDTLFSRNDTVYDAPGARREKKILQEKAANKKGGVAGIFQKLGNLPEWDVPGYGQLRGKALNTGIAWASCLAFLMFGVLPKVQIAFQC